MQPEQTFGAALDQPVGAHVQTLKKRLSRATDPDADAIAIHDARTALRRVREELAIVGATVGDQARATRLGERLREIEKALAKPRDLDVMIEAIGRYVAVDGEPSAGVVKLQRRLERRRARAMREARAVIEARTRKVTRGIHRLLIEAARGGAAAADRVTPHLVRHFVRQVVWTAYDDVLAFDARRSSVDALHGFRAACRRLRFALELFADALHDASVPIARLRHAQDAIGDLHDRHVATGLVAEWLERGVLDPSAELTRFMGQQERERDSLHALAMETYEEVLGPSFRAAVVFALEPSAVDAATARDPETHAAPHPSARPDTSRRAPRASQTNSVAEQ